MVAHPEVMLTFGKGTAPVRVLAEATPDIAHDFSLTVRFAGLQFVIFLLAFSAKAASNILWDGARLAGTKAGEAAMEYTVTEQIELKEMRVEI